MKRNNLLIILAIFFLFVFPFVSAEVTNCCERLNNGNWCQNILESEVNQKCDSNFLPASPTSCEQTTFCALGTCIDSNQGICMPNTPKIRCESEGGTWDIKPKSEIPACQNSCCIIGDDVAFVTQPECKQLATDHGVNSIWRSDVTVETECYALSNSQVKGACVFDSLDCTITTKEDCSSRAGTFNEGFLCTADFLGTNCAKTKTTRCDEDGKVYFLDSCNNFANVYDSDMFISSGAWTPEATNYWIEIQDPICGEGDINCGNCDYIGGSICRDYQESNSQRPKYGDNVCASLGCSYNGKNYAHGESWCAESPGIFSHLQIDPITGELDPDQIKELTENYSEYNLPGSRYTILRCMDGEVIVEPCRDYRNEICVESTFQGEDNQDYSIGNCVINNWRDCFNQSDRDSCDDSSRHCKWVFGYRYDFEQVTNNRGDDPEESRNAQAQGSCVPLFAPGFDFWNEANDGISLCGAAGLNIPAIYETHWTTKRDTFGESGSKKKIERCLYNCYLIPDFGKNVVNTILNKRGKGSEKEYADIPTILKRIYEGTKDPRGYYVSLRKGQYCDGKTGVVLNPGDGIECAKREGDRSDFPIFFTHEEWLDSIRERARSLGDCGYKSSANGVMPEQELEIVTAIFQKLKQDMETVKGDGTGIERIYAGDEYLGGN
jgi:hypothetical protein